MPFWHDRLEFLFPYWEYALPNVRYALAGLDVTYLSQRDEPSTRLIAVPKTQSKPRLIAAEPVVMQYIQQAICGSLVPALEKKNSLSGSFVGFTDQTPNQEMAREGSRDGSLATLDLSDASDRVANWLVEDLFADFPYFLEGIQACRSLTCQLPSGEVIPLQKFASMGSALTFPIEAIIFATIALTACLGMPTRPTTSALKQLVGSVRVYGDDIIVPTDKAEGVIDALEACGFKVNRDKSSWTGPFRESCGKEYFYGIDVSIVFCREKFPSSLRSVKECVSLSSFRNQLFKAGWIDTVDILDRELLSITKERYPYVQENSQLLGRVGPDRPVSDRLNPDLHRPEQRGFTVCVDLPRSPLDDVPALLKCLMHPEISEFAWDHLERSGRPRAVSLKLVWAPLDFPAV